MKRMINWPGWSAEGWPGVRGTVSCTSTVLSNAGSALVENGFSRQCASGLAGDVYSRLPGRPSHLRPRENPNHAQVKG